MPDCFGRVFCERSTKQFSKIMTHSRVLCLGEVLSDYLADQPGVKREQVQSWTAFPGGAPANVACGLVKLGTTAAFIGGMGTDQLGNDLLELLKNIGVNVAGVALIENFPTRQVYVERDGEGNPIFAGFSADQPDHFADAHLSADILLESLFVDADYLVLGTLELAYPATRQAIAQALEWADKYYVKILVDVNWRPAFWRDPGEAKALILDLLKDVDFVKLSQDEALWLFNTNDPSQINYQLDSVEGVLITNGAAGCHYCLNDQPGQVNSFAVPVVDTTGAGDAFVAGFIHQLCSRGLASLAYPQIVEQIMTYACAVGALTTQHLGAIAGQPDAQAVEEFLANRYLR
jgi:fructokinase